MAAIAKGAKSQLGRFLTKTESVTAPALLDGSLIPIATTNVPPELRDLSHLVPIVVLGPTTTIDERCSPQQASSDTRVVRIERSNDAPSRMQVPMARLPSARAKDVAIFGGVLVSFSTMEVRRTGQPVLLTRMEFRMLEYLIKNPRRVISRDELLNQVWGYKSYPCTRTIDTHILGLRRKLEQEASAPKHFLTVHGVGYKFVP